MAGAGDDFDALGGRVRVMPGDCLKRLRDLPDESVDAVVTDPPYHMTSVSRRFGREGAAPAKVGATGAYARASRGFMGQEWDGGDVAFRPETWAEVWRVLKPGAHLMAFGSSRSHFRLGAALEDAGFEARDTIVWIYGSGFPKSAPVAKHIDRVLGRAGEVDACGAAVKRMKPGADQHRDGHWRKDTGREYQPGEYLPGSDEARAWAGTGTALKPAAEYIYLFRKPLRERSVAAQALATGTGPIGIDAARVGTDIVSTHSRGSATSFAKRPAERDVRDGGRTTPQNRKEYVGRQRVGRWPANVCHDGSEPVLAAFAAAGQTGGGAKSTRGAGGSIYGSDRTFQGDGRPVGYGDAGTPARFFYCAKAGPDDRLGFRHATVKPVALIEWLVKIASPQPGQTILDPFAGTGTLAAACVRTGRRAILMEMLPAHVEMIRQRLAHLEGADTPLWRAAAPEPAPEAMEPGDD